MRPIKFNESNVIFAEGQPQYKSLPACKSFDGVVTTCWKLTFLERFKILFTGKLWLRVLTFNEPLQPLLLSAHKLFLNDHPNMIGATIVGKSKKINEKDLIKFREDMGELIKGGKK